MKNPGFAGDATIQKKVIFLYRKKRFYKLTAARLNQIRRA